MRRSIAAFCLVAVALLPACSRDKAPNSLFDAAGYHVRGDEVYYLSATDPASADAHLMLADLLIKMGARIQGAGGSTIRIEGVDRLHGAEHTRFASSANDADGDLPPRQEGLHQDRLPESREKVIAPASQGVAVVNPGRPGHAHTGTGGNRLGKDTL